MMVENLQRYIQEQIPITSALGIRVVKASKTEIALQAPFSNNINHKKTVFGGSLHAVAALACWGLVFINLEEFKPVEIVITHSNVDYIRPVVSDFIAICQAPEDNVWDRFFETLHNKKKARIHLQAKIYQSEKLAVDFKGTFAAIRR